MDETSITINPSQPTNNSNQPSHQAPSSSIPSLSQVLNNTSPRSRQYNSNDNRSWQSDLMHQSGRLHIPRGNSSMSTDSVANAALTEELSEPSQQESDNLSLVHRRARSGGKENEGSHGYVYNKRARTGLSDIAVSGSGLGGLRIQLPASAVGGSSSNICRASDRPRSELTTSIAARAVANGGMVVSDRQSRFFQNPSVSGDVNEDRNNSGGESDDDFAIPPPQPLPRALTTSISILQSDVPTTSDMGDERNTCTICTDPWSISGPNRVVSLKCGHLFCNKCIRTWMLRAKRGDSNVSAGGLGNKAKKSKCPDCNHPFVKGDIRPIYARSITAVDAEKLNVANKEINTLQRRVHKLEAQLSMLETKYQDRCQYTNRKIDELKDVTEKLGWSTLENKNLKIQLVELLRRQNNDHDMRGEATATHQRSSNVNPPPTESPAADLDYFSLSSLRDLDMPEALDADNSSIVNSNEKNTNIATKNNAIEELDIDRLLYSPCMKLRSTIRLAANPGESMRHLVFHPHEHLLYASYSSASMHTLAQINIHNTGAQAYMMDPLHTAEIRGAEASPHQSGVRFMLTASTDKTAVLVSIGTTSIGGHLASTSLSTSNNTLGLQAQSVQKRTIPKVANRLELGEQGWSCTWDPIDSAVCYIGCAKGKVLAFDLRNTKAPLHTWDGPKHGACLLADVQSRNGALADAQQFKDLGKQKVATGFSPVHSIAAVPWEDCRSQMRSRLVIANAAHVYALPVQHYRMSLEQANAAKETERHEQNSSLWVQLTNSDHKNGGDYSSRSCYSMSFDAQFGCVAASFRAQGSSKQPVLVHELYKTNLGVQKDSELSSMARNAAIDWQLQQRFAVDSAQTMWAKSTVFSYQAEEPYRHRQALFCAGVEASCTVKVWDAASTCKTKELLDLNDTAESAAEPILDVKGWQWGGDPSGKENGDNIPFGPTFFSSLTRSTIRLYEVR
ncbi:hypothetical protein BX070DRAFT_237462 [Coemansia spiralis]|nr:hypothetical protein BX070DRAFT_237462 [Coemansia spiralis]